MSGSDVEKLGSSGTLPFQLAATIHLLLLIKIQDSISIHLR